jgi:hypothetical protein
LGYVNGLKQLNEEKRMSAHAQTPAQNTQTEGADGLFDFFARSEGMWWPFRSVSKALLQTQSNALAYLEANRRLLDEMRNIVRKEQNLVIELSETALKSVSKPGSPSGITAGEPADVNEMFGRAMVGIRELGEAWIDAQVRSLDMMRLVQDTEVKNAEKATEVEAEAA